MKVACKCKLLENRVNALYQHQNNLMVLGMDVSLTKIGAGLVKFNTETNTFNLLESKGVDLILANPENTKNSIVLVDRAIAVKNFFENIYNQYNTENMKWWISMEREASQIGRSTMGLMKNNQFNAIVYYQACMQFGKENVIDEIET